MLKNDPTHNPSSHSDISSRHSTNIIQFSYIIKLIVPNRIKHSTRRIICVPIHRLRKLYKELVGKLRTDQKGQRKTMESLVYFKWNNYAHSTFAKENYRHTYNWCHSTKIQEIQRNHSEISNFDMIWLILSILRYHQRKRLNEEAQTLPSTPKVSTSWLGVGSGFSDN